MAQRHKTQRGNRYFIYWQTVAGRSIPFVHFEHYAFSLEYFSIEEAEDQFLYITKGIR